MKKIKDGMECWARSVVMSDGLWHTKGHFSNNGSFIVKKYMTGGLLLCKLRWCLHYTQVGL